MECRASFPPASAAPVRAPRASPQRVHVAAAAAFLQFVPSAIIVLVPVHEQLLDVLLATFIDVLGVQRAVLGIEDLLLGLRDALVELAPVWLV